MKNIKSFLYASLLLSSSGLLALNCPNVQFVQNQFDIGNMTINFQGLQYSVNMVGQNKISDYSVKDIRAVAIGPVGMHVQCFYKVELKDGSKMIPYQDSISLLFTEGNPFSIQMTTGNWQQGATGLMECTTNPGTCEFIKK